MMHSDQPDTRQAPPERRLWQAVLIQGLSDHLSAVRRRDSRSAEYRWPQSRYFALVCDLAGFTPKPLHLHHLNPRAQRRKIRP